jgi:hypothetical protein
MISPGTHFFCRFEGSGLYFLGEKSVKTGEISNHTHLLLATAILYNACYMESSVHYEERFVRFGFDALNGQGHCAHL